MKYPSIKFVKKTNMYCVTYWDKEGNQQIKMMNNYHLMMFAMKGIVLFRKIRKKEIT